MEHKTVWDEFLDALYPPDTACFACGLEARVNGVGLCAGCALRVKPSGVLTPPQGLSGLYAGLVYNNALHEAMHKFKYGDERHLARNFAVCMSLPEEWEFDCIIPVPLHEKRERQRGYNQSLLIAKELAKKCGKPVELRMLNRVADTPPQAEMNKEERQKNMERAFSAAPSASGRAILLVDDVVTTGSTLMACAAALKSARAARVYAACACAAL